MKLDVKPNGTVSVRYPLGDKDIKIKVSKGRQEYIYNHNAELSVLPLQMGKGFYTVKIYRQVRDKEYRAVKFSVVYNKATNPLSIFLCSSSIVNYSENSKFVAPLKKLLNNVSDINLKIYFIQKHIIEKLEFYKQGQNYPQTYIPDLDSIYLSNKGICYDYAVLFAAMLRYSGIPCKVVLGNANGQYHAWNELYINGKWVSYDLTVIENGFKGKVEYIADKYY